MLFYIDVNELMINIMLETCCLSWTYKTVWM